MSRPFRIAVLGGTGAQGKGLALRFAAAGHAVTLGSRDAERARTAAGLLNHRLVEHEVYGVKVDGAANAVALEDADIVVLAVPYAGYRNLIEELAAVLAGRIIVSCVNPLGFDGRGPFGLDMPCGSAAEEAQALLPDAHVVGAFHHVSADALWDKEALSHEDVLVCGDDPKAKAVIMELARTVTHRPGIDAGALRLARHFEPLTAVLISVNRRYKVRSGVRISGLRTLAGEVTI